jgi:hypothetical protein
LFMSNRKLKTFSGVELTVFGGVFIFIFRV